ncbi:Uncharacterised protein [Chryseobacterium nakagawai]|uniref:Uncharacterized protein n=2 Tax=Chryseobacterium nakagawai TaxID=1241982 RepID=A0AAD0YL98_CHRNA|nr:hypothetical protein EG343_11165 [Chryseobacterium nakagawai]VEH22710.1 Uncharacterised protein [Chryseobacterium nakagawai]
MENMEEIEAKILIKLREDYKNCGGANGSDINEIDEIIKLSISDRNELLAKMVKEKKITFINTLNARRITLPK